MLCNSLSGAGLAISGKGGIGCVVSVLVVRFDVMIVDDGILSGGRANCVGELGTGWILSD